MSAPTTSTRGEQQAGEQHPAWCSPEHCHRTEDTGVRVHEQAPVEWERFDTRFSAQLVRAVDPDDGRTHALELADALASTARGYTQTRCDAQLPHHIPTYDQPRSRVCLACLIATTEALLGSGRSSPGRSGG